MATLGAETHAPSLRPRARGAAEAQASAAPRKGKGGRGAEAASPSKRASKRAPWNGDAAGSTDDGAPPPKLLDAPGSPVGKRVHEALGETRNPVVLMGYANGSAKAWVATLRGGSGGRDTRFMVWLYATGNWDPMRYIRMMVRKY